MSILFKSTVLIAIIVIIWAPILAQYQVPADFSQNKYSTLIEQPEFDHLILGEGVSHLTVNAIIRDRQGFMWFATTDGAYRYDGYNYKIFKHNPRDSTSLAGNDVSTIFQDSHDDLWFGTTKGLCRLDSETGKFQQFIPNPNYSSSLLGEEVYDIYEDNGGNLWVGTWGGLNLLNRQDGTFRHFRQGSGPSEGLPDNRVMDINQDQYGTLWIATLDGLCAMVQDANGNMSYKHYRDISGDQTSLYGNSVYWVHADNKGGLWVGTHSGFCRINRPPPTRKESSLDEVTFSRILPLSYGNNDEIMWKIDEDQFGNFWLSSWGKGFIIYNPQTALLKRFQHHSAKPKSLSDNTVNSLYIDAKGVGGAIWIGTLHGIDVFFPKKRKFAHYRHDPDDPESISNNHVHSIFEDSHGDLWIGTMEGLNRLKKGEKGFQHYFRDPANAHSLSANLVMSIYEDRQENLWFGTYEGLNYFDRTTERFLKDKNLIRIDDRILRVFAFYEDVEGNFWLGTRHGLIRYNSNSQTVKKYDQDLKKPNALPGSEVRSLLFDQRGVFWIGTTGGLAIFNKGSEDFYVFSHLPGNPHGLSNPTIWKIYEDSRGDLWFGTNGGLNKLVRAHSTDPSDWHFEHFTEEDGLPANHVSGILEDDSGYLWLSTTRGLSRFDPKKTMFKNYDSNDGLQSNDFTNAGYFKTSDGKLLFGGINGLNVFDPDSIIENKHIPPVVFTDFRIFDKPVNLNSDINSVDEIKLSYRENFFSFEFAALDFTLPNRNSYAYRMQGFDSDWIYSGSRRYASYTNLDPGEYVFRVKGSNSDGVWNEDGISLKVIITPPFWATWWFRLFAIIMLAGTLYMIYRFRLNSILQVERTRTRIARDLHDDVSATLSGISWFAHAAQSEKNVDQESKEFNRKIIDSATDAQEKIRDIIWAIQPEHDKWDQLFAHCQRYAADLLESNGIKPLTEVKPPEGSKKVDMNVRQNFWLLFKEIITNAIKHSKCKKVKIRLISRGRTIYLEISDDGIGFDAKHESSGNGLINIRARAADLNAECRLHSKIGKGTRWEIELKV